ncbi:MAG: hypothetical protein ACOH5I_21705 [Oligoflexus sp.]
MGLQRRTAIAALAIQRRIAEALSDQPFAIRNLTPLQVHKKLIGLGPIKHPDEVLHDIKLVQIFQQSLGLRPDQPNANRHLPIQDIQPVLLKLKVRAKEQLKKQSTDPSISSTTGSQLASDRLGHISNSYESLTNELLRVSEQRDRSSKHPLSTAESFSGKALATHRQATLKQDSSVTALRGLQIKVPVIDPGASQPSIPRLEKPPHTLQAYRLRLNLEDEQKAAPSSEAKVTRLHPKKSQRPSIAGLKRLLWQSKTSQADQSPVSATRVSADDHQQSLYLSLLNS